MRQIIRDSIQLDEYLPQNKSEWEAAYEKFKKIEK